MMNVYATKLALASNTWAIVTSVGDRIIASGLYETEAHQWVCDLNAGIRTIPKPWMDKLYPAGILTPLGHVA